MKKRALLGQEFMEFFDYARGKYDLLADDHEAILGNLRDLMPNPDQEPVGIAKFSLDVARPKHPIHWNGDTAKIYEIVGANLRNKTTTLIYIATLLGVDWGILRPYIKDEKMVTQAENVMSEVSSGIRVKFRIENGKQRFEVDIREAVADILWWRSPMAKDPVAINNLSLKSDLDWAAYREAVSSYFDVQVVSKGRDFVSQVGVEEATDLATLCEETRKYVNGYWHLLKGQRGKKDPRVLKEQIEEQTKKLAELGAQIIQLQEVRTFTEVKLSQAEKDLVLISTLSQDRDVKELLELSARVSQASSAESERAILKQRQVQLQELIGELAKSLDNQSKSLSDLNASFHDLGSLFDAICDELSIERSIIDRFRKAITEQDIDALRELSGILLVDSDTRSAHRVLADYTYAGLSLGTRLVGFSYLSNPIPNLSSFRESMRAASKDATVLEKISTHFNACLSLMDELKFKTTEDLRNAAGSISKLAQNLESLRSELTNVGARVLEVQRRLRVIQGDYGTLKQLRNAYHEAKKRANEDTMSSLETILARHDLSMQENVVEKLSSIVDSHKANLADYSSKIETAERYVMSARQLRAKKQAELDEIEECEDLTPRLASLTRLSDFLRDVSELIQNWKLYYETQEPRYKEQFDSNRANLGDDFQRVISLINTRIRVRCPFAFVNSESGTEKRAVTSYDFLGRAFEVEGLAKTDLNHGGMRSSMTVYGLATRRTDAEFGLVLLVDEWGDVGVYEQPVFDALSSIPHLALGVFVDIDISHSKPILKDRS